MKYPVIFVIELICYLSAIQYLTKKAVGDWYYFTWFMLFTALFDGTGWALVVIFSQKNNYWIYNIVLLVSIFFISWRFFKIFQLLKFNSAPWIMTGTGLVLLFYFAECCYHQFIHENHTLNVYNGITLSVFAVLISIAAATFYYLLLKRDEYINLLKDADFWFVTGCFIFYFVGTAIHLFFAELIQINVINGIPLRYFISIFLNLILYGCWTFAFRCRYLQTISSSSS